MKKILIIMSAMHLGGAERSLLGLLQSINKHEYDVDLFFLRQDGDLLKFVPSKINILPGVPSYETFSKPILELIKSKHFLLAIFRTIANIASRIYVKLFKHSENVVAIDYSHKFTLFLLPRIQADTVYDLAISFITPHYILNKKVYAKKKVSWIHTDYSQLGINIKSELKMWNLSNNIISISEAVSDSFLKVFPTLKHKLVMIENILPSELIIKQASEMLDTFILSDDSCIKILSIGRFTRAKNFDNIPIICNKLLEMGLNVKWYIIGYGNEESLIKESIVATSMEENVIILGKRDNPYPYIKACDVYIQPSRYEGKCVAVREAQMLGKPVIITNYSTAKSQLENGVDGIIVPMDNDECAEGIAEVLRNKKLLLLLSDNCSSRDYSNSDEIHKIYKLMN